MSKRPRGNDDPRGEKRTGTGLTARLQYGRAKEAGAVADWATVSPVAVAALIGVVTDTGAAILFGYSRDRGAYRVLIMDDAGKAPVWIPCTTDVDQALEDLTEEIYQNLRDGT